MECHRSTGQKHDHRQHSRRQRIHPWDINVIIEIPIGGVPVKYEIDKASGAMVVDRFLHTSMFYPCNYGFIPHAGR